MSTRETNAVRVRARVPAMSEPAGFRASSSLDESSYTQALVLSAVALAKRGDPEGVRLLYTTYANNIYGYVRSLLRDDHEAEDLTQQVFAKLITAIARYDDRGLPFFAWLLRLARNLTIDHIRGNRAVPSPELFDSRLTSTSDLERPQVLRDALDTLPPDQRKVVILRHVVGLSPGEIAERMGRSEGSIHGLHHRGRVALRRELVQRDVTPFTRTEGMSHPLGCAA